MKPPATPATLAAHQALVLELLKSRGPLPISEIRLALAGRVPDGYVTRAVDALLAARLVTARRAHLAYAIGYPAGPRVRRYWATVYAVRGGR